MENRNAICYNLTMPVVELIRTLPQEVEFGGYTQPAHSWPGVFCSYCKIMRMCDLHVFESMCNIVKFDFLRKRSDEHPYERSGHHAHIVGDWYFTDEDLSSSDIIKDIIDLVETFDMIKNTDYMTAISLYVKYWC